MGHGDGRFAERITVGITPAIISSEPEAMQAIPREPIPGKIAGICTVMGDQVKKPV
jgi:hypothetical protein